MKLRPAIYTCGALEFPKRALSAPRGAELRDTPPARALAAYLAGGEAGFPKRGWRVLAARARVVEYGHDGPPGPKVLTFEVRRAGEEWEASGYGGCLPERVIRGFSPGIWALARDHEPLSAETRVLRLAVGIGACESFSHVEVSYGRKGVNVLVLHRPDPPPRGRPSGACPAVLRTETRTVRLPGAIGRRGLYDARTTPPVRVARAPVAR